MHNAMESPKQQPDNTPLRRAKNALWRALRSGRPDYAVDAHNLDALTALSHWLIGEPYGNVRPGSGLKLNGGVGTGKTDLMRALSKAVVMGGGDGFKVIHAVELVKEYNRSGDKNNEGGDAVLLRYAEIPHLCIDDIGTEQDGKHFGKEANVVAELIQLRYSRFRQGRAITHMTTNANASQLAERYDERTLSRIGEMCCEIALMGGDRREQAEALRSAIMPRLFQDDSAAPDSLTAEQAAPHFERITQAIKDAAAEMKANAPLKVVRPASEPFTQADHLTEFTSWLPDMGDAELARRREMIEMGETPMSAEPYLKAIDAEIARRATDNDPASLANAGVGQH